MSITLKSLLNGRIASVEQEIKIIYMRHLRLKFIPDNWTVEQSAGTVGKPQKGDRYHLVSPDDGIVATFKRTSNGITVMFCRRSNDLLAYTRAGMFSQSNVKPHVEMRALERMLRHG